MSLKTNVRFSMNEILWSDVLQFSIVVVYDIYIRERITNLMLILLQKIKKIIYFEENYLATILLFWSEILTTRSYVIAFLPRVSFGMFYWVWNDNNSNIFNLNNLTNISKMVWLLCRFIIVCNYKTIPICGYLNIISDFTFFCQY